MRWFTTAIQRSFLSISRPHPFHPQLILAMPGRGAWNPIWLFLVLRAFHAPAPQGAETSPLDDIDVDESCWGNDWPDFEDGSPGEWVPTDDGQFWCQDQH